MHNINKFENVIDKDFQDKLNAYKECAKLHEK